MSLLDRKHLIESYKSPVRPKVKRTVDSYTEMREMTFRDLTRLIDEYKNLAFHDDLPARLQRDKIDWSIKRYQKYCINENIGSHYIQKNVSLRNCDVIAEHVIPETVAREMLLDELITIDQALHTPICKVSRQFDNLLTSAGLVKQTPNSWFFFSRYISAAESVGLPVPLFETYNGKSISIDSWGLHEHFVYFNIPLD